ncbi:YicC-like domain-containing protein [Oleidesulfovibrio alaskensis G20]|uniref:YicC-like domain-containing protein n=1 Tax=Oleidesulfovibrio alaskensis (strain ATCC BAA-1058 / DSM 17464 / G20) TaxID=207559 RepID=Q30XS9_OLEA2|nr:YicC/YloC family endoribonuclease [Oleidesulfovibrio alaskensis]ABB39517.1 YicC-like domain-containing protein [Oleidesulfovibrio alaskensis G20]MBG0772416.1 YicC family protein [Oleidesulfovibrio alaskensis]MBL3582222.1 YicC family protein [Oleidesulfovibrio alaskensis]
MLRSMTGFGRCTKESPDWTQTWEIRSVNSRHLDIKWRLPGFLRGYESRLEKVLRRFGSRGRVDVSLSLDIRRQGLDGVSFNTRQAASMLEQLTGFAAERGDAFVPDYNRLLNLSYLWEDASGELDETLLGSLEEGLAAALADWNKARETEAQALLADLETRIGRMRGWAEIIAAKAPAIKDEKFTTLRERIAEILEREGLELEPNRFLQEITIMSDKLDISEEITRMDAHLTRLGELLHQGTDAGKRLDFTLQECFREINTCGNKVQDPSVSRVVVDFKNELEKCREQVQNIE